MSETRLSTALAAIRTLSAGQLSDEADCGFPQNDEARSLLERIRDGVVEAFENNAPDEGEDDDLEGVADQLRDRGEFTEIADGAPSVYTHPKWEQFVGLAAYHEDPTELGFDGEDMGQGAGICLFIIGERLAEALARLVVEAWQDAEGEVA